MTPKFKKLAVAAGVSSILSAMSMPSHAVIQGAAGEALLVPLVVYATKGVSGYDANTIIQVSVPGSIGFDDVPNIFTAPNTTPTNPGPTPEAGPTLFPNDPDLSKSDVAKIHWYWFDKRSVHRLDKPLPVTANDVVVIDWKQSAETSGKRFDGEPGYMVIGTEIARRGEPANFAMFGDAWLEIDAFGFDYYTLASIPVLPMADGKDGMYGRDANGQNQIGPADNVVYKGGIPTQVSPLISGIRTNRSDGLPDIVVFDLPLLNRTMPAMHVVWLDRNLDDIKNMNKGIVAVDVYDSEEVACSATAHLPNELNVIWVDPVDPSTGIPQDWPWLPIKPGTTPPKPVYFFATHTEAFCLPDASKGKSSVARPNFVSYYVPEYVDNNVDRPESAAAAFTLAWTVNVDISDPTEKVKYLQQTMILGHERGTYRQ